MMKLNGIMPGVGRRLPIAEDGRYRRVQQHRYFRTLIEHPEEDEKEGEAAVFPQPRPHQMIDDSFAVIRL